jgi:hypothetical protein
MDGCMHQIGPTDIQTIKRKNEEDLSEARSLIILNCMPESRGEKPKEGRRVYHIEVSKPNML